ncbi:hypothetical protein B0T10DRAFT_144134 [Thelonectria olida]|uniref:NACHT domain-containing protein n=1 Tax=Thelonectria olida TaxID=1576542 RepID=A0A9P8VV31_9HYPO|nr:hypothetical protein B0T10DRAFT_144134 [Thelonectria olida]
MKMDTVTPSSGQAIRDVISAFLKTAVNVHQVAHAVHNATPSPTRFISVDHDMEELAGAASLSVLGMLKLFNSPSGVPGDATTLRLMHSCVKIGQDIAMQIDRARPSFSDDDAHQVDVKEFCSLWPRADVVALHERLSELAPKCQKLMPSNRTVTEFSKQLSSLTIVDAANRQEGEDGSQKNASKALFNQGSGKETNPGFEKSNYDKKTSTARLAPVGLINDFLLESLAYKSMYDREEEVTEAHSQTLEWIFNSSIIDDPLRQNFGKEFTTWLKTNDLGPIYWITGKPGSGKSTLTAFLSQHSKTKKLLQGWAGARPVCPASFFFWTSGTRDQRSQNGLLRSLLHQLLSANPDLMPSAFPELWQKLRQMSTKERVNLALEWTVPDLMAAFRLLLDAALPKMNICLFIDGLDEFEGDHTGIVDFFKTLSTGKDSNALKMCLSSRPWSVFEAAFGQSVPNGRLQDLTYDDMCRYTRDELQQNRHIRHLFKASPSLKREFVESAVQQADGVFLWVRLAVERILSLVQADTEDDLKATLRSFPSDLDDFFDKLIFKDQNEAQITETSHLFRLICARELVADFLKDESSNALTAWELAFALSPDDDDLVLERQVKEASLEEIVSRYQTTAKHVMARFSGLLSLHRRRRLGNLRVPRFVDDKTKTVAELVFVYDKVTYIHRTVRDWLMNPDGAYNGLQRSSSPGFDPHLRLLRSYVLRLKHPLEEVEHHRRLDEWYPDIALAMTHARYITDDTKRLQSLFLNEMNQTLSWYWLSKPSDPFDHWARSIFGSYEVRMKAPSIRRPFLCLATKFGLTEYVSEQLQQHQEQEDVSKGNFEDERQPTPLLSYATEFLCSRSKTIFPVSSPDLVEYLLAHPSKINPGPNEEYSDFTNHATRTPWLALLRHLRDAHRRGWIVRNEGSTEGAARWAKIVQLFIDRGAADVNAVVVADSWDPEITAVGVLKLVEEASQEPEVQRVRILMEEMQKTA